MLVQHSVKRLSMNIKQMVKGEFSFSFSSRRPWVKQWFLGRSVREVAARENFRDKYKRNCDGQKMFNTARQFYLIGGHGTGLVLKFKFN